MRTKQEIKDKIRMFEGDINCCIAELDHANCFNEEAAISETIGYLKSSVDVLRWVLNEDECDD